ncbi:TPA: DUF550 domain-containing protein [Klebsiella pneumoniae subsp. pneumoniae]|nr:DUF550 domain-containing protein [Klebsiella pneumoniae subsp. pneumoniae]
MTKSTITRERIQRIMRAINSEAYDEEEIREWLSSDEIMELSRMALAAMDNEPVALQPELAKVIYHFRDWNEGFPVERFKADYVISWMLANYPPAQPAKDREQVRREHAEWSQATFGNVGPVGPLKHLSKEALEAAAEPGDLSEWADMQFLLWDAQRRAGITDEQITQAMIEKLAVNKQRSWPEPKDGEPRLHINEQPALTGNFPIIGIDLASGPDRTVEVSYVAPPGYVMVPMRLTAENGAKGALSGEFSETKFVNCPECFGDDECETCDGSGRIEITVPVTWTTIKEIWAKGVEHFAAAPQSPGSDPATVPGKWIPVSERMPIEFEAVIAFDGDQVYGEAMYSSDDGFTIDGYEPCDRLNLQNVTHWMELPAAPQEVK